MNATTTTAPSATYYDGYEVTVLEVQAGPYGQEALVQYETGLTVWVSVHDLTIH